MAGSQAWIIRKRRKRPRRRRHRVRFPVWLPISLLAMMAVAAGGLVWMAVGSIGKPATQPLPGYVQDDQALRREYARLYNRPLPDSLARQDFRYASELVARADFAGAIPVLERISEQVAVPAVFNNLGVLYLQRNDISRAVSAFREAYVRDADYPPVRANLTRLKPLLNMVGSVTREIEPNDNYLLANVVSLERPVDAEISAAEDTDCFRFRTPPPPRDILAVEIENLATTLAPAISLFDSDDRFLGWTKDAEVPGRPLVYHFSPPPNTVLLLHVWGSFQSLGKYRLTIRPLKAFDRYEPNDDILKPTPLTVGQAIEANIMDEADTDFYSFAAPASGTARVEIRNRSDTLIPALFTFSSDRRPSGSGPELHLPGANLSHTFAVTPGRVYYIQVRSRASTAGAYSLTVR
jgi:hypothetical protein